VPTIFKIKDLQAKNNGIKQPEYLNFTQVLCK
jgi:hypothetical protein